MIGPLALVHLNKKIPAGNKKASAKWRESMDRSLLACNCANSRNAYSSTSIAADICRSDTGHHVVERKPHACSCLIHAVNPHFLPCGMRVTDLAEAKKPRTEIKTVVLKPKDVGKRWRRRESRMGGLDLCENMNYHQKHNFEIIPTVIIAGYKCLEFRDSNQSMNPVYIDWFL
jgi:hypothetical protein